MSASQPLILRLYTSPIGKKLITGITGLGLATFVLLHMVGNLLLFVGRDTYNAYGYFLERSGPLLWTIEVALMVGVLIHGAVGIQIFWGRLQARPQGYAVYASKGGPSRQSFSSRTMIVTGSSLGIFLILHLLAFKFGPWYVTELEGQTVRDLSRLVIEKFHQPAYAFGYSGVIVLLGFHLRHGIWSAFQSLGAMTQAVRPLAYGLSLGLAIAIALGFIGLPLAIYVGIVN